MHTVCPGAARPAVGPAATARAKVQVSHNLPVPHLSLLQDLCQCLLLRWLLVMTAFVLAETSEQNQ